MNRGRPCSSPTRYKHHKAYVLPGRYEDRLNNLKAKKQKLEMLHAIIQTRERLNPAHPELKRLLKRANEVRAQLLVLSTTDPVDSLGPL